MEETEKFIKTVHQGASGSVSKSAAAEGAKEERKDVAMLEKQLSDLQKAKKENVAEFDMEMQLYMEQQSQIRTGEWIANRKALLLKKRSKEAATIKMEKEKCEKLIGNCQKIAQQFNEICAPEEDKKAITPGLEQSQSAKEKKKKKKKKKKAETLIGALGLDTLREEFEYFSISSPKKKEDLGSALTQLQLKLNEINNRPLTETLGIGTADIDNDSLSVSSLSFTSEQ